MPDRSRPAQPDRPVFGSIDAFRTAAAEADQAGKVLSPEAAIRASFETTVKAAEEEGSRVLTFTISTASVDRMGDTIAVDGWKLDAYRKNPVVLWAHDSYSLPVAKAPRLWIEAGALKAEAEFTPSGMARFNDTVFDMLKLGFLNATSVGFMPTKWSFVDDPERRYGIDFLEQELLEFSVVPVPANAEALIEGRAAGIDVGPVLDWCEAQRRRAAGDDALWAERIARLAESVQGAAGPSAGRDRAWAERILAREGLVPIKRERVERIERAAKAQRLAAKRVRDQDLIRLRAV